MSSCKRFSLKHRAASAQGDIEQMQARNKSYSSYINQRSSSFYTVTRHTMQLAFANEVPTGAVGAVLGWRLLDVPGLFQPDKKKLGEGEKHQT